MTRGVLGVGTNQWVLMPGLVLALFATFASTAASQDASPLPAHPAAMVRSQENQSATPPASDADAWGDPVGGVQLHLAVAKNAPPQLPGELPHLEIQICNMGNGNVIFNFDTLNLLSTIEIDGVWYGPIALRDPFSREVIGNPFNDRPPLTPGQQSMIIPMGSIVPRNGLDLGLSQGKHTIRIQTPANVRDGFQTTTAVKTVKLMSNAITIEIPALSASAQPAVGEESTPSEKDGLSVVVQSSKGTFAKSEALTFKFTYRNVSENPFRLPDRIDHYGLDCLELDDMKTGKIYTGAYSLPTGAAPNAGDINPIVMRPGESMSAIVAFRDFGYVEGAMECAAGKRALFRLELGRRYDQSGISFSPPPGTYSVTVTIQFNSYPDNLNVPDDVRRVRAAIENDPVPLWKGGKVIQSNPIEVKIE